MNVLSAIAALFPLLLGPSPAAAPGGDAQWMAKGDSAVETVLSASSAADDDNDALGDPDDDPLFEAPTEAHLTHRGPVALLPTDGGVPLRPRLHAHAESERGPPLSA
jgi:hypothetical protein